MAARLINRLGALRRAAGLSQSALAERLGVSRQALIAIEAGRQTPSTALALQMAQALDCTVEALFSLRDPSAVTALLATPAAGRRVILGQVDGRWIAHPLQDEGLQAADGLLTSEAAASMEASVTPLQPLERLARTLLIAGCAPLLGLIADRLRQRGDLMAHWVQANSGHALDLLAEGAVHLAGVHLTETHRAEGHVALVRSRFPGQAMSLIHLTRWRQGLMMAPDNPLGIQAADDLVRPDITLAWREAGAGANRLLTRALAEAGAADHARPGGPEVRDHSAVARLVQWGVADAGVAIEGSACSAGLTFVPLAEERFDLVLPTARLTDPGVARLLDLLTHRGFRSEVAHLPGYDVSQAGDAIEVPA